MVKGSDVVGSRNRKGKPTNKGKGNAYKGNEVTNKGKGDKGLTRLAPKPYWARTGGGGKGGKGGKGYKGASAKGHKGGKGGKGYRGGGGKGGGGSGGAWKHGFSMEGKCDAHGGRYVDGGYVDWTGQFFPHLDVV